MAKGKQYTMLDTELSIAVDEVISLIEEQKELTKKFREAENKLKHEMDRCKKPEIIHIKGYEFTVDYKLAEVKLKIKKPKQKF